jgi:nucleoid-associated protein YgaU
MKITRLHLILLSIIALTGSIFIYQTQQEVKHRQEAQVIAEQAKKEVEQKRLVEVRNKAEVKKDETQEKEFKENKQKLAVEAVAVAGEYWKLAKEQGKDISIGQATLKTAKEALGKNDFETAWELAHRSITELKSAADIVNKKVYYKVRHRDCLWKIAKMPQHYGHGEMWPKIWKANKKKIHNPRLIYPKQVFYIPDARGK